MLVCHEGQVGVQLLAERPDDRGFVKLVVGEELQWLSVKGDVDLADSVVGGRLRVACTKQDSEWLDRLSKG